MTTQEYASKFDIPMPETCQKLDWKKETFFYWVQLKNIKGEFDEFILAFKLKNTLFFIKEMESGKVGYTDDFDSYTRCYPAPNAQELFEALPSFYGNHQLMINSYKVFYYDSDKYIIDEDEEDYGFIQEIEKGFIFSMKPKIDTSIADALAKLYILLRENDLLPKN